jgi:hypothetical protein
MSRGNRPRRSGTALPSAWCSYRIVDENGTVVAGDWANADGGSGLELADRGEHELNGLPRPGASSR